MEEKSRRFWPMVWIVLVWFVAYSQLLFWHRWIHWDMSIFFLPNFIYANDIFRAGQLPLWNPFLNSGLPWFSNPQSHLWYLPNQLIIWTAGYSIRSIQYELLLHYLAAGMAAYVLARKYLLSPTASTLAAVSYMLSGIFVGNAEHFNAIVSYTWMPLAVAGVEGWFADSKRHNLWLLGASLVLMLTGGHFGPDIICFLFLAIIVVIRVVEGMRGAGSAKFLTGKLAPLVLACAVAALLSGICLVPVFADMASFSNRGKALPDQIAVDVCALPGWGILTLILPALSLAPLLHRTESISMLNCYLGLVCLCLAWFAIYSRPARRNVLILAGLGVAGLLLALGGRGALRELTYNLLPFFDRFRHSALFRGIFILFFCLLGGFGLERLQQATQDEIKSFRRVILILGMMFSVSIVLTTSLALIYSRINRGSAFALRQIFLETLPLQVLILLALFIWLGRQKKFWTFGVLFLSSLDLTLMAQANMSIVGDYIPQEAWNNFREFFLEKIPARSRTIENLPWEGRIDNWNTMNNNGEIFKRFQIGSYGFGPTDYSRLMDTGFYKLATKFPRFFMAPEVSVRENFESSLPEFAAAAATSTMPAFVTALPPERIRVMEDAEYSISQASADRIEVVSFSANRLELAFHTESPVLLASTETYHPGWVAWLDGGKVPTVRVNFLFRGSYVPTPGDHRLVWEFRPKSFDYGLGTSALGIALLLVWTIFALKRNRQPEPA